MKTAQILAGISACGLFLVAVLAAAIGDDPWGPATVAALLLIASQKRTRE